MCTHKISFQYFNVTIAIDCSVDVVSPSSRSRKGAFANYAEKCMNLSCFYSPIMVQVCVRDVGLQQSSRALLPTHLSMPCAGYSKCSSFAAILHTIRGNVVMSNSFASMNLMMAYVSRDHRYYRWLNIILLVTVGYHSLEVCMMSRSSFRYLTYWQGIVPVSLAAVQPSSSLTCV